MLRTRWPAVLFVPWSLYVWVTRVVNAFGDDDPAGRPLAVVLALSFVVPTIAVGIVLIRARRRPLTTGESRLWLALAAWTVAVWLVRGAQISMADHGMAFKVVHVAVGLGSIALAAGLARATRVDGSGRFGPARTRSVSPPVEVGR
jgi:hypothetical protein